MSEVASMYWFIFFVLLVICGLLRCVSLKKTTEQSEDIADCNVRSLTTQRRTIAGFLLLRRKYFAALFLALFSDWLQGPYLYQLYSSYGFSSSQIGVLYVVGFASSALFGTATGVLADWCGRRWTVLAFCILYATCCFLKVFPDFRILLVGRVFGGIATSMLVSAFESWYVHEHVQRNGFIAEWMSSTFAATTFWNGVLAIGAGIVANVVAETLAFGPVAPFLIAIPVLLTCVLVVMCTWSENYGVGTEHVGFVRSCSDGIRLLFSRELVLRLGVIQSLFETTMHVFVFIWTPLLDANSDHSMPLGLVFACFMVCIMIGSSIHDLAIRKAQIPPEQVLLGAVGIGLLSMLFALFTHFAAFSFLVFEVAVGLYYPATSYLRSKLVPESHRTAILNWLRLPTNVITCFVLVWLHDNQKLDVGFVFAVCSASLAVAFVVGVRFAKLMSLCNDAGKPVNDYVLRII